MGGDYCRLRLLVTSGQGSIHIILYIHRMNSASLLERMKAMPTVGGHQGVLALRG